MSEEKRKGYEPIALGSLDAQPGIIRISERCSHFDLTSSTANTRFEKNHE
jgi:hypothetical protein